MTARNVALAILGIVAGSVALWVAVGLMSAFAVLFAWLCVNCPIAFGLFVLAVLGWCVWEVGKTPKPEHYKPERWPEETKQ